MLMRMVAVVEIVGGSGIRVSENQLSQDLSAESWHLVTNDELAALRSNVTKLNRNYVVLEAKVHDNFKNILEKCKNIAQRQESKKSKQIEKRKRHQNRKNRNRVHNSNLQGKVFEFQKSESYGTHQENLESILRSQNAISIL